MVDSLDECTRRVTRYYSRTTAAPVVQGSSFCIHSLGRDALYWLDIQILLLITSHKSDANELLSDLASSRPVKHWRLAFLLDLVC